MSDSGSNKVEQSDINAAGDVAGRDLTKTTHNHYYKSVIYKEDSNLRRLIEEHENEIKNDPAYKEFSERLNCFLFTEITGNKRNLEQKLSDGDREHFIDYAKEVKERVTKKIQKSSHYKSAQEIYTYLLTNIRTCFLHEVYSKVKSGQFQVYEIDELVKEVIINPFLQNVQGCSLQIDNDELYGLLYILTGNCYIEWDQS